MREPGEFRCARITSLPDLSQGSELVFRLLDRRLFQLLSLRRSASATQFKRASEK